MGLFESEDREVVADTTAIFVMIDSPLLTIQAIAPYIRSNGRITVSNVQFSEMPGDDNAAPCPLLRIFSDAPVSRVLRQQIINPERTTELAPW
jgi:hypothetical protein